MNSPRNFLTRAATTGLLAVMLSGAAAIAASADAKAPAAKPAATPAPTVAKASPTAANGSFDSFRLIGDRNIFDPNRRSRVRSASNEPPVPTGDTIAFVGTMDYDQGIFAFFDSSDARYRRVLPEGGKLAEFVVKHVEARRVDLTRDGKVTTLDITQQLHRPPEGGDWAVTGASPIPAVSATADGGAAPTVPAVPADASDILKRLMEQRQKQLKE
jgi:hypothetical protein